MAIDTASSRTRRALLTAGLGAGAATVASAIGRPLPAKADDGGTVILGYSPPIGVVDGIGVNECTSGTGIYTTAGNGFMGWTSQADFNGVFGYASAFTGSFTIGVFGASSSDTGAGVRGLSPSIGVLGQSSGGRAVYGETTTGQGVRGQATTGVALYGETTDPMTGYALRTVGRVRLDKCVGVATIASGTKSIVVTPGIDLTPSSAVVASLMGSAGGTTTVHRSTVNPTGNTFTIYLTANSTTNVKVAWHVFG